MVRPGFGFMRDGASLGMLREMLVMIRIWGLLKPGCLPTFTATSDNQDSMQLLFRLLTKLWLCCKKLSPDPDQTGRTVPDLCQVFPCSVTILTICSLCLSSG